jgi:DNA polymerase
LRDLHYDYETFSPVDLKKCGHYRYAEEAEIILLAYAFDDEPVKQVDALSGEEIPQEFLAALQDPSVNKFAQNHAFERVITRNCLGIEYALEQTYCTAVWAASLGLPANLDSLSEVLGLGDKAKLKTGKALIRKFCVPRKPTKKILRTRNMPTDFPEDWEQFKLYNRQDVEAEREVHRRMKPYPMPESEWKLYRIDQKINDRGIRLDSKLVMAAIKLAESSRAKLIDKAIELTNLQNPNSRAQLLAWLDTEDVVITDLQKKTVEQLLDGGTANEKVIELLKLRQQIAKTSVTKYLAMARAVCKDGYLRGMFKFNGAGRTSRWAGQIVQLQNLPSKGLIYDIELARETLLEDPDSIEMLWSDISQMLASLIRTALLPDEGEEMPVIDFSSIEARILAWLANEQWRLDLFASGGKMYETSAEKMFNLPPGSVTKKDPNRQKGKVAELALGYQGWEGALITMGALEMGLLLEELAPIASAWRKANPAIEAYWKASEDAAYKAVQHKTRVPVLSKYQTTPLVHYDCDGKFLTCILPSGRKLYYAKPKIGRNDRGNMAVSFEGLDGVSKQWRRTWLYGGLQVENQCQAVARDCLCDYLVKLDDHKYKILLHVHDEVASSTKQGKAALAHMETLMAEPLPWAPGLLLTGDGFVTNFYRKDPDD